MIFYTDGLTEARDRDGLFDTTPDRRRSRSAAGCDPPADHGITSSSR